MPGRLAASEKIHQGYTEGEVLVELSPMRRPSPQAGAPAEHLLCSPEVPGQRQWGQEGRACHGQDGRAWQAAGREDS